MIASVFYYIALGVALIILCFVFYTVFHAYYNEYKETPKDKKPRKLAIYSAVIIVGIVLVIVGNHFFKNSEYIQNLLNNWTKHEERYHSPGKLDIEIPDSIEPY